MAAKVMGDIESLLRRWQTAGVVDAQIAARIRAHEAQSQMTVGEPASVPGSPTARDPGHRASQVGLHWQGITALVLGAILLACGVVLFVSAHWNDLGRGPRFAMVCAMVAVFHLAGGVTRAKYGALSSALHAVGTIAAGPAIALAGQTFNIEEHWPGAFLLWALAALAGWAALRDQAQETLALLSVPVWIFCEIFYRASGSIGEDVTLGRFCFVWAILYLTFFVGSKQRAVQGILFAASAIAALVGVAEMLTSWASGSSTQMFLPFDVQVGAWVAIAGVPLVVAAFHGHKGLIPIAVAIGVAIALPWCYHTTVQTVTWGPGHTSTHIQTAPNLPAYLLVAGFTVFLCGWGVRLVSRALVNLAVVGFAVTVGWFYFSNIMDKASRSLGLIGLGVLFLAGGWVLEKMRRRLLAGMEKQGVGSSQ